MIRQKINIAFFILLSIAFSCRKNKPKVGLYKATFHYTYPDTWDDDVVYYKITETNKSYFLIGISDILGTTIFPFEDTIYKDKKNISGQLSYYSAGPFILTGKWSKNILNDYLIEGDFVRPDYTQGGTFYYTGTFSMNSNLK